MESVPVERRGIAGGVRTMMNSLGMVISMAVHGRDYFLHYPRGFFRTFYRN